MSSGLACWNALCFLAPDSALLLKSGILGNDTDVVLMHLY